MSKKSLKILLGVLTLGILYLSPCAPGLHASMESLDSLANMPGLHTPQEIKNAWLRFHKDNVCQKIDAAFIFEKNGLTVFYNIESRGQEKELLKLLEPLQNSHPIDLVPVQILAPEGAPNVLSTPPGFWVNSRLVERIHDSLMLDVPIFNHGLLSQSTNLPKSLQMQKRMLEFSREIFEYTLKVKRLAAHLPLLARTAYDPDAPAEFRKQALEACRKHARDLEKYAKRLRSNLEVALPHFSRELSKAATHGAESNPVDEAARLSTEAHNASALIYNFMYEKNFTVDLSDLRNPPVINSMRKLLQITEDFRNSIS